MKTAVETYSPDGFRKNLTPGEFFTLSMNNPTKKIAQPETEHPGTFFQMKFARPVFENNCLKIKFVNVNYHRLENKAGKVYGYKLVSTEMCQ